MNLIISEDKKCGPFKVVGFKKETKQNKTPNQNPKPNYDCIVQRSAVSFKFCSSTSFSAMLDFRI